MFKNNPNVKKPKPGGLLVFEGPVPPYLSGSEQKPKTVEDTLKARRAFYGPFIDHARYADAINCVFESSPNWKTMPVDSRESLRSIAGKIARILNGDPEYDDNWRDIAGYATLVEKRINDRK